MSWGRRLLLLLAACMGTVLLTNAQEPTCKWKNVEAASDGFLLDSLSAIVESITVVDSHGNDVSFRYSLNSGLMTIALDERSQDSLLICYLTLPYSLHRVYANRTLLTDYDSTAFFKERNTAAEVFDFREEIFTNSQLNKTGNLTRGISFGNRQNMFVNSSLNLQMDGKLAENLYLRASITDQNVPFQPEGNTQQLQDFDKVLIELYNDNLALLAGDVVLKQRKSEFLRYQKNVQGLLFTSDYQFGEKWKASTQVGASLAKGKFASMELKVMEGVLGPYRINGPKNERFVIIMGNSEKVFLDGKLLKRGFNYDYIIDYNRGEITFTSQVMITRYSRVQVDFEYAERNFSRSILMANHIQERHNVDFYLNFYREKDNRNRPLFFELSDADKKLLAASGSDLDLAIVPRIDSIPFDPNRILYRKIVTSDKIGNPMVYYEYSTDPAVAYYSISFEQAGPGGGHYRRKQQLVNGMVFEFVPPLNGMPQGEYTINSPLTAPDKKQMITAGTRIRLNPSAQVYTEVAFSDYNTNLFSKADRRGDKGFALKSGYLSIRELTWRKDYRLETKLELEHNSSNFSFIDRYRDVEFDRDWSLSMQNLEDDAGEKLVTAEVKLTNDQDNLFSYTINLRNRKGVLKGTQHYGKVNQQIGKRWYLSNDFFSMNSMVRETESKWIRYHGGIQYRSKILMPGYKLMVDRNTVLETGSDSVVNSATNFLEHRIFFTTNDSLRYSFFGNANWREDRLPLNGVVSLGTKAFTTNYGWVKKLGPHDIKGTFTYRKLRHPAIREGPDETTVMGKMDYLGSLFDNSVRNELTYAIGSGRELKREYVFLPVAPGEGTHTWRDDNEDGIPQINEFYLAINQEEKDYVKIFVPSDEYILAYTNLLNYRLNIRFPHKWRDENGIKPFLYRFSNATSWNVEKKVTDEDFWSRINPFFNGGNKENIVSVRQFIRSTLFFNRSAPDYGMEASFFNHRNKQLYSGGFEDLIQKDLRLTSRYHINRIVGAHIIVSRGVRGSSSDFMENRNYSLYQYGFKPELTWQPALSIRGSMNYAYTAKRNRADKENGEKASINQVGFNFRYAKAIKTTLNADLNYTNISYSGEANSPIAYEMLQALMPGRNYIWRLHWLQKIGEGLQLNVGYEGRNSEGLAHIVHTGRMQVSALF